MKGERDIQGPHRPDARAPAGGDGALTGGDADSTLSPRAQTLQDISRRLDRADLMLADRSRLRARLRGLERIGRHNDVPATPAHLLDQIAREIDRSAARVQTRLAQVPRPRFDAPGVADLPVVHKRAEIADAIRDHQVVIVCGATGSGKTTQLPKICLDLGRGVRALIGHTQPRRIAARAVAARIAQELGTTVGGGGAVGFKVRFTDESGPRTFVKLMTDGILLAETQGDRLLNGYDTIIVDEAHERSINIDFLLGYLRQLLPRRPDLKVIITSATIDPRSFAQHFTQPGKPPPPVIEVTGRTYPVEIRYRPLARHGEDEEDLDLEQGVVEAVEELAREPLGESGGAKDRDVLVFLPGEREIRETAEILRKHFANHPDRAARRTEILPLFARLSTDEQQRIFAPHAHRRIILATNVAETSLTVPGIRHVIDSGLARISRYSPRIKVQRLPIEPISRASANQRAGRCGRTSPGIAVRLYAEDDFARRPEFTDPEVLRTNLASVILQMKAVGLGEIDDFPFMQAPDPRNVRDGYDTLQEIGALQGGGLRNHLTGIGAKLARLPVDPRIGRMILAADAERCLREVLVIAAALSVQDPRERPIDKVEAADAAHALFKHDRSDFLAFLNLWREFHKQQDKSGRDGGRSAGGGGLRKWCRERFISFTRMREWQDTHAQLHDLAQEMGLRVHDRGGEYPAIHRSLLTGLLSSIGRKSDTTPYEYQGARDNTFAIFPGSGLFRTRAVAPGPGPRGPAGTTSAPTWIMAAEIVKTTKTYARTVAAIEPRWIEQLAQHLVKHTYHDPHWDPATAQAMAYETVNLFGLEIVKRRRVPYGPVEPGPSRTIFIQHALVNGELLTEAPFFEHNHALQKSIQKMESKTRTKDLLADPSQRFGFYSARIPEGVNTGRTFEQWLRKAEVRQPRLLEMEKPDLLAPGAVEPTPEQFPDTINAGAHALRLEYIHDPGADNDGLTAVVPERLLDRLPDERFDWLVPGMLRDKAIALIKALPKHLRASLAPAPLWADRALERMPFAGAPLSESLSDALRAAGATYVPSDTWSTADIPPHLVMRFRVVDEHDAALASGRSLGALRAELARKAAEAMARIPGGPWNRAGVSTWEWEEFPERVELRDGVKPVGVFPALVDEDQPGEVSVRPFDTPEKAAAAMVGGLRRLLALQISKESRSLIETMPGVERVALLHAPLGSRKHLIDDLAELAAMMAFDEHFTGPGMDAIPPPPSALSVRTREQFVARLDWGWSRLGACGRLAFELAESILVPHQRVAATLMDEPSGTPTRDLRLADIRSQLDHLILARFLGRTPYRWLAHFPRYLRAIQRRLERVRVEGEERDLRAMDEVLPFWKHYLVRTEHARARPALLRDPALIHYRWMIEEFRVSLFAQQLGAAAPVSARRLAALWERVG